MSNDIFAPLPSLFKNGEYQDDRQTSFLPPIHAAFFVPKLENKPQNPIIDSLDFDSSRISRHLRTNDTANGTIRPAIRDEQVAQRHRSNATRLNTLEGDKGEDNIWMIAASGSDAHGVRKVLRKMPPGHILNSNRIN